MSYRILIVDDSEIIRTIIKRAITMAGVGVDEFLEASHGVEALHKLENDFVDIIFTDLNMPQMDGVDLIEHLMADKFYSTIPIVVVSSEHNPFKIKSLGDMGIHEYIKKPFRPEVFRTLFDRLLET